jgi:hypothetical protein
VLRDERRAGCGIVVLTVIGGLGLLYGFVGAGLEVAAEGEWGPLALFLLGLLVVAGVSTLVVFVRSKGDVKARGIRRIVRGTLALTGSLIVVGALLGLAAFAFLFAVCVGGGGRF